MTGVNFSVELVGYLCLVVDSDGAKRGSVRIRTLCVTNRPRNIIYNRRECLASEKCLGIS